MRVSLTNKNKCLLKSDKDSLTLEVIKKESSRLNIKMPLVDSLYNIIYKESSANTLIDDLVNNPHEVDVEFKHTGN